MSANNSRGVSFDSANVAMQDTSPQNNTSYQPTSCPPLRHTWKPLSRRQQLTMPLWAPLWPAMRASPPPLRSNIPKSIPSGRRTTISGKGVTQGGEAAPTLAAPLVGYQRNKRSFSSLPLRRGVTSEVFLDAWSRCKPRPHQCNLNSPA